MYVDKYENQFCVESDKATGAKTFYNPISLTDEEKVEVLDFFFTDEAEWVESNQYRSKFYKEEGY